MGTIKIILKQNSETSVQLQHDQFKIIVDRPKEKGGGSEGLMGGQYMLTGVGGCFCSTLFAAAQSRDIQINGLKVIVEATLSDELPKRFTDIVLYTSYENCSHPSEFEKLLAIAEQGCISVNTMKKGVTFRATQN
ncbi:OsmC family peroxiredoxin [Flavobacteriaceae bacterium AU392]|nr:OsmC family peroxiredoxin [Flavobacteriaceae bacterium]RKM85641.1 OsmC family peroxiredoxin [Flavobacteriaceae bacterium AU392]